jgi:hypothetical protein
MAVNSLFSLVTGLIPALLGFIAHQAGLSVTMWLLLLGPIALVVGIPRHAPPTADPEAAA